MLQDIHSSLSRQRILHTEDVLQEALKKSDSQRKVAFEGMRPRDLEQEEDDVQRRRGKTALPEITGPYFRSCFFCFL